MIELRDADGKPMNDFSGRSNREQGWTPPKGTERTLVVALDTAQYQVRLCSVCACSVPWLTAVASQIDVTRQVEAGGPDVYAGLNLLVRRKPKENNFKAILDCIRDLMSEDTAVPEWLHDIFLGYGDPAAAQYRNMRDAVPTLDFKVRSCFLRAILVLCQCSLWHCFAGYVSRREAPGVVLSRAPCHVHERGGWRRAGSAVPRHLPGAAARRHRRCCGQAAGRRHGR